MNAEDDDTGGEDGGTSGVDDDTGGLDDDTGGLDDDTGASETAAAGDADESVEGADPATAERELGSFRGWVLVGVLAFSLLGAPLLILWRPPALPYWAALLALPMIPAILLGIVGVWATTRP